MDCFHASKVTQVLCPRISCIHAGIIYYVYVLVRYIEVIHIIHSSFDSRFSEVVIEII